MKLKFGEQLIEPDVRRLYDLRDVAFDTAWFEAAPDRDAYLHVPRLVSLAYRRAGHHAPPAPLRRHDHPLVHHGGSSS